MRRALDVCWLPSEWTHIEAAGGRVAVVDVLRATTTIVTALAAGARRVIPIPELDEARELAGRTPGTLLCGEREGRAPPGFDLGNSPSDFTPDRVAGRTLVFTTTNGTSAMRAAVDRGPVALASFRNLGAVASWLAGPAGEAREDSPPRILCSGRRGRASMDDAWCAGHLVERSLEIEPRLDPTDGARAASALARALGPPTPGDLARLAAGRALRELGLEGDLIDCARVDDLAVVPVWDGTAFVKGGEEESDAG